MSLSVYLSEEVYNSNITHNLNKMAAEAGIYRLLWYPEEEDLTFLYEKGLSYILIEIFTDISVGQDTYLDNDLHEIIFHAVKFCIGPVGDPNFILSGLPIEEYNQIKYEAT